MNQQSEVYRGPEYDADTITVPTPSVGRIVLVIVDKRSNNGSDIAPAVITRVWGQYERRWTVNYRLLLDHRTDTDGLQEWRTSAYLHETEDAARAWIEQSAQGNLSFPDDPEAHERSVDLSRQGGLNAGMQAFWPPRV